MWIKICGMTTPEAVRAALDVGVDAIGFVFARSVRQVSPAQATQLAAPARGRIPRVAVTRHPSQHDINQILEGFNPDVLQTDSTDLSSLQLPKELALLPVFRDSQAADDKLPARLLFEGGASGTGLTCDWSAARRVARRTELVLAGGLNPDNVAAAIEQVLPFGVDVSTGVEARPGFKNPAEIVRFVTAARASSVAHKDLV